MMLIEIIFQLSPSSIVARLYIEINLEWAHQFNYTINWPNQWSVTNSNSLHLYHLIILNHNKAARKTLDGVMGQYIVIFYRS